MKKITGIYKITSPSNRIYIGQSVNIHQRWRGYKYYAKKIQTRLYNSFKKYGVENHTFEIIEECSIDKLNERERYWQEYYDVLDQNKGLNCRITKDSDRSGYMSEETKIKFSKSQIGRKISKETKLKWSKQRFGGGNSRARMVINLETGIYYDCVKDAAKTINVTRKTLSNRLNEIQFNNTSFRYVDTKENSIVHCDTSHIIRHRKGILNPMNKMVLNINTGIYYDNRYEAAFSVNMNVYTLSRRLRGENKKRYDFKYV